ncbi:DMT family transporter [Natrarchaeobius sp. A-rgal3]|uniref:DMT family transporter n=1 Tax=Natrarchaeobius versutus TaxID=1679078 RepID=UPI00350ED7BD
MPSRYGTAGMFVLLATLWGTSFVAARAALADVPPVLLAALRFDIAAVLMAGYALATTDEWVPTRRSGWYNVVLGGALFVAAHHALLFAGQQYVTSAVAAVVVCLDPILAAGFARTLLPDERLERLGIVGLVLGLVGVAVVANPSPETMLAADVVGVALIALAAAAFALGAVTTRRFRTTLPVQTMQAWMLAVGAVQLHVLALFVPGERMSAITWSWPALVGLWYLAVVAAAVGYLLYFELLDRLGPIEVSLVAYVAPIFAAIGGWIALEESIRLQTIAGFGLVGAGFVLLKRTALVRELETRYR